MSVRKFEKTFGGRITCTIQFDPARDHDRTSGYTHVPKRWEPQPSDEEFAAFFSEYCEWIHTVYSEVSKLINRPYRAVLQDRRSAQPHWEAWVYEPDGTRTCASKGNGYFQPYAQRQN